MWFNVLPQGGSNAAQPVGCLVMRAERPLFNIQWTKVEVQPDETVGFEYAETSFIANLPSCHPRSI